MKKQILSIYILFSISVICLAQDTELSKRFTVGGIINYQQYKNNDPNINTTSLRKNTTYEGRTIDANLYVGYQIHKNGMLGITGILNQAKTKFSRYTLDSEPVFDTDQGLRSKYGIGILYRQYLNLNTFSRIYIQPSALISRQTNGPSYNQYLKGDDAVISNIRNLNLNIGAQFNIHKNWYVILDLWEIEYENSTTAYEQIFGFSDTYSFSTEVNNLDFSFNIEDISLGIEFIF